MNTIRKVMQEYLKCASDIEYFADTYLVINGLECGLSDYQKSVLKKFTQDKKYIANGREGCGKSTIVQIIALHQAIFKNDNATIILTPHEDSIMKFANSIVDMFKNLPEFLRLELKYFMYNSHIRFSNQSDIFIGRSIVRHSKNGIRVDNILFDDSKYFPALEKTFASLAPCITVDTTIGGHSGPSLDEILFGKVI